MTTTTSNTKEAPTWSPEVAVYVDALTAVHNAADELLRTSKAADAAALGTGKSGRDLAILVDGHEKSFSKHLARKRRAALAASDPT